MSTLEVVYVKTAPETTSALARWGSFLFWWGVTLLTLILLDDLLFGPVFWALAAIDVALSTAAAFSASFIFQMWLIHEVLRERQGRIATWFIGRLFMARKRRQIVAREESIQHQVVSSASALAVTLLIGGVLPIVYLHRRQSMSRAALRRLSLATATLYAVEFALIHGGYGLGAVVRWLV